MGLTANVVANTPILSSWGNEVRDRSVQVFASLAERTSQWPSPPTGAMSWVTATASLYVYSGGAWVQITPQAAVVATSQTTTNTAYADLATTGPIVTVGTGTRALVTLTTQASHATAGFAAIMSVAVSGATTLAASDNNMLLITSFSAGVGIRAGLTTLVTGLTPGQNVFTARYKQATSGTATFAGREISVVGVP